MSKSVISSKKIMTEVGEFSHDAKVLFISFFVLFIEARYNCWQLVYVMCKADPNSSLRVFDGELPIDDNGPEVAAESDPSH